MKLNDILIETVSDQDALEQAAVDILGALRTYMDGVLAGTIKVDTFGSDGKTISNFGTIREYSDNKSIEPIGDVKLSFSVAPKHNYNRTYGGEYNVESGIIFINVPVTGDYTFDDIKVLKSTLVHEMRHALDDKLSSGKAITQIPQSKNSERDYLLSPHEINARVSEAMIKLKQLLSQSDGSDLKSMILNVMKDTDLYNVFVKWDYRGPQSPFNDKRFKKIYSRLYQYGRMKLTS